MNSKNPLPTRAQRQPTRHVLPRALAAALLIVLAGADAEAAKPRHKGPIGNAYEFDPESSAERAASVASQMLPSERDRALALINAARNIPRRCGTTSYPAVPAVAWNALLEQAAQKHSDDMATRNFFSHTGSDGSAPWQRLTAAGYNWRSMGENIAAGYTSIDAVVAGWLKSPGHCANIMKSGFREIGLARAVNPGSRYGTYWTLDLATPR
jgi:uncharacterized protein YkwD